MLFNLHHHNIIITSIRRHNAGLPYLCTHPRHRMNGLYPGIEFQWFANSECCECTRDNSIHDFVTTLSHSANHPSNPVSFPIDNNVRTETLCRAKMTSIRSTGMLIKFTRNRTKEMLRPDIFATDELI